LRSESLENKGEEYYFANGKTSNFQKGTNKLHHFYYGNMVSVFQNIMFIERHFINTFCAPGALTFRHRASYI